MALKPSMLHSAYKDVTVAREEELYSSSWVLSGPSTASKMKSWSLPCRAVRVGVMRQGAKSPLSPARKRTTTFTEVSITMAGRASPGDSYI